MEDPTFMSSNLSESVEDIFNDDSLTTVKVLFAGVLLSILIFMSIAGNILVVVAICTDRALRRIGNLFLASLAIADLFVSGLVMTFAVVNDLLGYWIFGPALCDTWIAFDVMCCTASILNLCAISMDRYIHIKDPLRYGSYVTRRVALGSIAGVWLLAMLISFLPISLGLHRPVDPPPENPRFPTCALDLAPTYAVVSSCISFYIPTLVMLGIYLRLYRYAQRHVQSIRAVTKPFANVSYTAEQPHALAAKYQQAQNASSSSSGYHVSDHKAAITVGIIMGVFLICWVPFFCVNIVAAFCKTCIPMMAFKILTWLGYSNSVFNPIIYSIFNTEFREAFKRILTARAPCCCDDCQSDSNFRSELNRQQRSKNDFYTKGACLESSSKHNGSCSQIRESSSASSVRHVRVSSTEKVVASDIGEVSAI